MEDPREKEFDLEHGRLLLLDSSIVGHTAQYPTKHSKLVCNTARKQIAQALFRLADDRKRIHGR